MLVGDPRGNPVARNFPDGDADRIGGGMSELVGRDAERAKLAAAIEQISGPQSVLLEGEAGVGKTVLWKTAIGEAVAAGHRTLSARAAEFESGLSFIGLGDLLAEATDEDLALLPNVQQAALRAALLRTADEDAAADWRALSAGVLGLLRRWVGQGPVVIGLDDVQWLDRSSANVLATALRRLRSEPVLVMMTRRVPSDTGTFDPIAVFNESLQTIEIAPLARDQIEAVIRARFDRRFDVATIKRIYQACGGNPFFAIEIARSLDEEETKRTERIPLPKTLAKAIGTRLEGLSDEALQVLLVMSAVSQPTMSLVAEALGDSAAAAAGVQEARLADVLERHGDDLRFTHPLFASTIYEQTPEEDRRRLHVRLGEWTDDIEERAAHLARSRAAPSEEVASALDDAVAVARRRGALERAAELAWTALDFTPDEDGGARAVRLAEAAELELAVGDRARLKDILEKTMDDIDIASVRARLYLVYSEISTGELSEDIERLTHALIDLEDPRLEALLLIHRARLRSLIGNMSGTEEDARAAIQIARDTGDRHLLARAWNELATRKVITSQPDAAEVLAEATSMPEAWEVDPIYESPFRRRAMFADANDDLATARDLYERLLRIADERGDTRSYGALLHHLVLTECRAGNLRRAEQLAEEMFRADADRIEDQTLGIALFCRALIGGYRGRVEEARTDANQAVQLLEGIGDVVFRALSLWALGVTELTAGRYEAACDALTSVADSAKKIGVTDPNFWIHDGDLIEALIGAGRLEEAEERLADLERRARELSRDRALAVAARCRGMMANQRGDFERALNAFDQAISLHDEIADQRFELARTLFAKGIAERRAKRRGTARETLARARALFEELGSDGWAAKADAEAKRIGGRAASAVDMTPTEEQVAALVAEGFSNREVAERLYLSIKTVEANLSRIYRKLDVRSRTQLAQKLRQASEAMGQT